MNQLHKKIKVMRIDESQLTRLLETYGGDVKRWPQEYRLAAHHVLQRSEVAQRLQQEALALDKLLDTVQVSPPTPWLRQRILAKARQTVTTTQDIWQRFLQWVIGTTPTEYLWRPAVTFLLPLVLGILIGFYSTQAVDTQAVDTAVTNNGSVTSVSSTELDQEDQEISLLDFSDDGFLE